MRTCEESSDESCLGREEPAGSIVRAVSVFARLCNLSLWNTVWQIVGTLHICWTDGQRDQ